MRDNARPSHERASSVQEDWRAWLPAHKDALFLRLTQDLETPYSMLSVSLNEAMSLRLAGRLNRCRQSATMLSDLTCRLAQPLASMLRALGSHARHHGTVPNAVPLNPAYFRSARCQRAAKFSALLSHVLFTQRSQYLHKVDELLGMVENLERELAAAASEVVDGTSVRPAELWLELDSLHYDLNTCLRESIVLLKSFLWVLPDEEMEAFEEAARTPDAPLRRPEAKRSVFQRGRTASIERQ